MIKWFKKKNNKINDIDRISHIADKIRKKFFDKNSKPLLANYYASDLERLITADFDSTYRQIYQDNALYKAFNKLCDDLGENFIFLILRCVIEDRQYKRTQGVY